MFLYNILLLLLLVFSTPYFLYKFLFFKKWRFGFKQRAGLGLPLPAKPVIWLHGASVGEVKIAVALIQILRQRQPVYQIYLSVITETGFLLARQLLTKDAVVIFAPLDLPFIVNKFITVLRPAVIGLIETELWPNLINAAAQNGVKLIVLNGRIGDKSFPAYKRFKKLFTPLLKKINLVSAQTEEDKKRFEELGLPAERIQVSSSIKYDLPVTVQINAVANYQEFNLRDTALVWTAGSIREGEEKPILEVFNALKKEFSGLKLVIAPRHLERIPKIKKLAETFHLKYVLKSELTYKKDDFECIILDKMGELMKAYRVATVVFVGGSLLNYGGQNILEPAGLAKPVTFGTFMNNFKDIADFLIAEKAVLQVKDTKDLQKQLSFLLANPAKAKELGESAKAALEKKRGALVENIKAIERLLKNDCARKN